MRARESSRYNGICNFNHLVKIANRRAPVIHQPRDCSVHRACVRSGALERRNRRSFALRASLTIIQTLWREKSREDARYVTRARGLNGATAESTSEETIGENLQGARKSTSYLTERGSVGCVALSWR